jgi:hypothetical protein
VQICLTPWRIEETFRFVKQSYNLEDVRVIEYQRLKNLVILVTWWFTSPPHFSDNR